MTEFNFAQNAGDYIVACSFISAVIGIGCHKIVSKKFSTITSLMTLIYACILMTLPSMYLVFGKIFNSKFLGFILGVVAVAALMKYVHARYDGNDKDDDIILEIPFFRPSIDKIEKDDYGNEYKERKTEKEIHTNCISTLCITWFAILIFNIIFTWLF